MAESYRVRRAGPNFSWPRGVQVAVVFNIAYEAWSPGQAPSIGPMGNVLNPGYFDTNADSWANYGAVRGIQRLMQIAEANRIATSVMVNGVLAERHPDTVKALHQAGHELVAHSYGMDMIPVYFDEAGERANIKRTTDLIVKASGVKPTGWISPRGTGSQISPRVLAEEGYEWYGDCNDDDLPSIVDVGNGRSILGIPLTMDINDLPHCIRYGNDPASLIDQFKAVLDRATKADAAPFMIDVTAHTHVFGRPSGAWVYDVMMKLARAREDIWIATRAEVAAHARAQAAAFA